MAELVDVSHSGVDLVKHKMYRIHYRFESCPDYKKLKQIDMDFDEEKEWDRLWIKHRNAMIHMLICGVILGWCIGIYC